MQKLLSMLVCVFLLAPVVRADEPVSRVFQLEGHGLANFLFHPDDDPRRVTLVPGVETPHIRWAVPSGAPVRALAIAEKALGRWPLELTQRFNIKLTSVLCHDAANMGAPMLTHRGQSLFAQHAPDIEARILQAMLEPLDVVVSDMPPLALSEAVRERLTVLIESGVGYVGSTEGLDLDDHTDDSAQAFRLIEAAVPLAGVRDLASRYSDPCQAVGELIRAWSHPHVGRVADLSGYPRDSAAPEPNRLQFLDLPRVQWEAWCSLLGRATLWAARRLPAEPATTVGVFDTQSFARGALPHAFSVESVKVWRIWDADLRNCYEANEVRIPRLPIGRYFYGLQFGDADGVHDWRFGTFTVSGTTQISEITLGAESCRPQEPIAAEVTLSGTVPVGAILQCEVIDNYGYVVWCRQLPAAPHATFHCEPALSRHLYNYINVKLVSAAGEVIDQDRRGFYITQPTLPRDELNWFVWEGGASFHPQIRMVLDQFARLGARGVLGGTGLAVQAGAINNMHSVIYAYRMIGVNVSEDGVASPSLAAPYYRNYAMNQVREKTADASNKSPLFIYLGDDVRYLSKGQEAGWSEPHRALLAKWAEQRFGTVAALNDTWGTEYTAFDDVTPIRTAPAREAAINGNPGPLCHWIDHQLFIDNMVADWWRQLGQVVDETAPGIPANIGSSVVGWSWPGCGFDFWQLAEGKNLVFQYPNPWVHDIFRSAAAPDALHGTWYGGYGIYTYRPYYDQEYLPWWSVFRGMNLHGLYYGGVSSRFFSERLLGTDLGPVEGVAKILDNMEELQGGIAKLLFNAQKLDDHIAVVYAPENLHASMIFNDGLPKDPSWANTCTASDNYIYMQSFEAMTMLLADMGFSYRVIPSSQLASGEFLANDWRCVVLPLHLRVSEAQATHLKTFVEGGGTVLADGLIGMLDERCCVEHAGALAGLLGVTYPARLPVDDMTRSMVRDEDGVPLGTYAVWYGPEAQTAEVVAHTDDGAPAVTTNNVGQGHVILLNLLSRDYQIHRVMAQELSFRDTIATVLAEAAAITPRVTCEVRASGETDWHHIQATDIHTYRLGTGNYFGFQRHAKLRPDDVVYQADLRPKPVWINLPVAGHVYDMRTGVYRGYGQRIEDVFYPARAELYAVLPYEVADLTVSAEAADGWVTLQAGVVPDGDAAATTHVLHVTVTDPTGNTRSELTQNFQLDNGQFMQRIFLGYNAEPGVWRVIVRDVASGMTREVFVYVSDGPVDGN